jgi:hypothetical protein
VAGSGAASFNGYAAPGKFCRTTLITSHDTMLKYLLPNQFAWPSYRINAWLHEVNDNMTVARSPYVWWKFDDASKDAEIATRHSQVECLVLTLLDIVQRLRVVGSRDLRTRCGLAPSAYRVHFFCGNVGMLLFSVA